MTDGGERDEEVHGSEHAGKDILCGVGRPTRLCSMGNPREHTIYQSHQDSLVRGTPASLKSSVVSLLRKLGLMVGGAGITLGPLIVTGMMSSLFESSKSYLSSVL